MGDIQIEYTIAIQVAPASTRTPKRVAKSGLLGSFNEGAVTLIMKQKQTTVAGDKQIGEAITVIIPYSGTMVVMRRLPHSSEGGDVVKRAGTVIME